MEFSLIAWVVLLKSFILVVGINYTPDGCEEGWLYYNQMCYLYSPHPVDAIVAKDICSTYKDSVLVSVWNEEEMSFITTTLLPPFTKNLVWIGLIPKPNKDKEWIWLDGSMSDMDKNGNAPISNKDICGALNADGIVVFKECWDRLPGFICKSSLAMAYIESDLFNKSVANPQEPPTLLFERIWPPKQQDLTQYVKHIAHTKAVSHETDCAFYCSHVPGCKAFIIQCAMAWKCNQYNCDLYQPTS
ncbi:uncharacterized protein [Mytilus edulis]|uniref:uncharacterized protein n=1 Tax=Mytilus edulis TaxID=6550 RepID=UPI0039EEBC83